MIILTTDAVPGREIVEPLGLVRGSSVRTKHVGVDIMAALRAIVGGELKSYSSLMAGAREQAIDRMMEDAARLGADAIVATRLETAQIMSGASEVVAYGTAVRLR
ncbi:YbjQ family protein [Ponticoccus sp. SC2-23]|uniref:YbjQ family protein n=1 Tax=Alexandriicola marinus TaxID=2081710 RepID=UPI000FD6D4A3|nr:YbjQ family protein [Alexandriicola marinus]MBM1219022.1 YbjQ family protein [Ponticoccus sp. SC6-9]MBM1223906.1 YbjQ family protein [Ponticoccus sp. SC6-15]MBM1230315.1 YbjQ family protein [Ponticoccus sp. SC6-38]MBM1232872.1 YbjQ family protein [Ponticoccus sp. SC6-45]MBM1237178.1 YbjQ family protein [Ponticoccus sp. SC6-49]MBM1241883.1 YbjQ family protein [Ponticoccus sp. SC2-64]MBM1246396.1 YbjQ family protein [Ponticoccus sp. SC6-42]MBM1250874.1 YbjQ family protein [Ponticoccus sp. 